MRFAFVKEKVIGQFATKRTKKFMNTVTDNYLQFTASSCAGRSRAGRNHAGELGWLKT